MRRENEKTQKKELKKALFIITSHTELGDTGKKTGFYYEELATPYWTLLDAGYAIDISSIQGGAATADPGSLKADDELPASVRRFLDDKASVAKVKNSIVISSINPDDYKIVFLPGGHGTMWDFAQSEDLASVISKAYENGAIIGSICHGTAGLLKARDAKGLPLLKDKRINSFTASEEIAVNCDRIVPYVLENEIRKLGAIYQCTENFKPYVLTHGRIVTGQNPASCALVSAALIEAAKTH
ncbi:type 1 glutamine amidotransferase domain-containing protein [Erwiniaceae bacterium CAU 1747]